VSRQTLANALELVPAMLTSMMVGQTAGEHAQAVIAGGGLSDFFQGLFPINVMIGIGAAVGTLCSQAYGADRHEQFWLIAQAGLLACAYSMVPITILSLFGSSILNLMGQDPALTKIAEPFILIGLAAYPFLAFFMVVRSAFQAQNIAVPFVIVSLLSSAIGLPVGYALGNYTSLAYIGVALSLIFSSVLKALTAACIVLTNHSYRHTWPGWQWRKAHAVMVSFWRVGLGSIAMTIFQSGGFMSISMLCGYLPNAPLAIAASSIVGQLIATALTPMLGMAIAGTVRIGNALGRGDAVHAARAAALTLAGSIIAAIFSLGLTVLLAKPYTTAFTDDKDTVAVSIKLIYHLLPLLPVVGITGAAQALFQACNAQTVGAAINCTFLLILSIAAGLVCALPLHGGLHGLWNGQYIGSACMIVVSAVWVKRLNWEQQALEASEGEKDRLARGSGGVVDLMAASPAIGSIFSSAVFVLDQRLSTPCSAILGDEV
jgi:multidrug resistance protein, MATE family